MYLDSKQHLSFKGSYKDIYQTDTDEKSGSPLKITSISTSESLSNIELKKPQSWASKYYALYALTAGLCLGAQAFLNQVVIMSQEIAFSYSLFLPVLISFILSSIVFYLKEQIIIMRKYGSCWSKERSAYFINVNKKKNSDIIDSIQNEDEDDLEPKYRLHWFNIFGMIARCIIQTISFFCHVTVMYTCILARVNFSLIINIYSVTPFLVTISFYFIFKERLSIYILIGIVLILSNIVITAISNSIEDSPIEVKGEVEIWVPILFAISVTIFFTGVAIISRFIVMKGGHRSQQIIADGYILQAIIFLIVLCFLGQPYPIKTVLEIGAISILGTLGTYLINEADVHGKAGPSYALMESQSLFLLIMEIIFLAKYPNYLQIIGFSIGIIGGLFIAIDSIRDKSGNQRPGIH